ncbi:MAG: BrnT family toxin [Nitrosomonas sp.]|nr:BrnT family toxin [Nitrosomonas sp.]
MNLHLTREQGADDDIQKIALSRTIHVNYCTYNVTMIRFEWDTTEAASNEKKHGISFEEAKFVFHDEFAVQFYNNAHSGEKHCFLMLAFSCESRMLLVCHCERESGDTIRIISARKATKCESKHYKGNAP